MTLCIECNKEVRPRQHAISCDNCDQWQHRTCNSGISLADYNAAKKEELDLHFLCGPCTARIPSRDENEQGDTEMDSDESAENDPPAALNTTYVVTEVHREDVVPEDESTFNSTGNMVLEYTANADFTVALDNHSSLLEPVAERSNTTHELNDDFDISNRDFNLTSDVLNESLPDHSLSDSILKEAEVTYQVVELGTKRVKASAAENIFRPAMDIVESTWNEIVDEHDFQLSKPNTLKCIANRYRQKTRPAEPQTADIMFQINVGFLQSHDFLRAEVVVDDQRHLIFATDTQLQLLRSSRRWFMDGTFKIVRRPFIQLWSIHSFIHKGDEMKQVPLAFVMMTRRTTEDYFQVLQKLNEMLEDLSVEAAVLDFESGWHRRINKRCNGTSLGFYILIPLLRKEADMVTTQLRLVQDHLYTRDNRRKYCRIQERLNTLWDDYMDRRISTSDLLT